MEIKFTELEANQLTECLAKLRTIIANDPGRFGKQKGIDVPVFKTASELQYKIAKQERPDLDLKIEEYYENGE